MRKLVFVLLLVSNIANAQQRILCAGPTDTTCPPACRMDLSDIGVPVQRIPISGNTAGMWLGPPISKTRSIVINADLPEKYVAAALHHERCHEKLFITTGKSAFHP